MKVGFYPTHCGYFLRVQEISYAQEQNQETSYAQAQLQETSIQT